MTARMLLLSIFAAIPLLCTTTFGAVPLENQDFVARFEGTTQAMAGGHPITLIIVKLPTGTSTAKIAIPNDEPLKGAQPLPKKELADAVKRLTIGAMAKISVANTKELGPTLISIEPFEAKPGEATPNGYVFSKTFDKAVGKTTTMLVVLTKYGVEHTFTIVTRRGEKGEQEQDPDVLAAIGKLTEGNSVWVQTQGSKIVAIEPYTEPLTGKLLKLGDTEVDGHKIRSADIEQSDGKTVTVLVSGKANGKAWVPDTAVNAALGKVRPGSQVEFRVHEDGDKLWLRDINAAPKTVDKKPDREMRDKPLKKESEKELPKKK